MNVGRYLARIGFLGTPRPDPRTLFALQRAHLRSVPFENLDIRRGRRFAIDTAASFEKIVERRRGGFCYELNGLFAELLESIEFDVTRLAAQVYSAERGGYGMPFAHLALRVQFASGSYLVDVGFGDSFERPLRLERRTPQRRAGVGYAIVAEEGTLVLMRDPAAGAASSGRQPQYRFDLVPHELREFEPMSHYQQTSPDSHFTQRTICSRATPHGRLSLTDGRLIETRDGTRIETPLAGPSAVERVLREHFGIG